MLAENFNLDNIYKKTGCRVVCFFDIQEYRSRRHIIIIIIIIIIIKI
jgi:hypothetical protein